jgi:hypothetical protein
MSLETGIIVRKLACGGLCIVLQAPQLIIVAAVVWNQPAVLNTNRISFVHPSDLCHAVISQAQHKEINGDEFMSTGGVSLYKKDANLWARILFIVTIIHSLISIELNSAIQDMMKIRLLVQYSHKQIIHSSESNCAQTEMNS